MEVKTISGKVIYKNDKWLTVKIDGYNSTHSDFVLINHLSEYLNAGDHFQLNVQSNRKYKNGNAKWFHVPIKSKNAPMRVVLGIGVEEMMLQPCIGNLLVKGNRVYKVKHCEKCSNGYGNGYFCEFWWKLICEDVTDSERGKRALKEQID